MRHTAATSMEAPRGNHRRVLCNLFHTLMMLLRCNGKVIIGVLRLHPYVNGGNYFKYTHIILHFNDNVKKNFYFSLNEKLNATLDACDCA